MVYDTGLDDAEIVDLAVGERRTILTRDRRLVERRLARDHLLIRSDDLEEQIVQVIRELGLEVRRSGIMGRCVSCNGRLEPLDAEVARRSVPPYVARTQLAFRRCPGCDRIYWSATHVERMRERLLALGLLGE